MESLIFKILTLLAVAAVFFQATLLIFNHISPILALLSAIGGMFFLYLISKQFFKF